MSPRELETLFEEMAVLFSREYFAGLFARYPATQTARLFSDGRNAYLARQLQRTDPRSFYEARLVANLRDGMELTLPALLKLTDADMCSYGLD